MGTASAATREFVIAALANVRVSLVSKVRVADVSPAPTVAVDMVNVSTCMYLMLTTVHGTKRKLLNASVTLDTPVRTVPCASALREVIPLPLCTSTTKAYTKSSAVTTYYQLHNEAGSLIVGPSNKASKLTATPFFMDPDFQGEGVATVNVDGKVKAGAKTGTKVSAVYAQKNGNNRVKFSFHPSFIGEQVNASIQALPNDVVRYSYVHTVFNNGDDPDNVLIYPSMGVPKFKTKLTGKDLKVGTVASTNSPYITGAGYCSPDSSFLGSSECANVGNFNGGKSLAVNDHKYRFPYFISPDDATKGPDALAAAYTNCAKNSLCIFITIPEPEGRKDLTVNYKFKTTIRTAAAAEKDLFPKEYTESLAREISNVNGGTNALVSVEQVGSDRFWHKLIDGTPII